MGEGDGDNFGDRMQARASAIVAIADAHDAEVAAKVAEVRAKAATLRDAVSAALMGDDFRRAAKLYKAIAALFFQESARTLVGRTKLASEADAYLERAKDCSNTLRRRTWAARHRRRGGKQ